ncbi:nuclear transport factor 2 family protein [Bradyrhizobium sp. RP6]|uniref:nuclear transport factor 2 family protein n=1 Tax=Bradyrhizobium sp. RP6 TaxID=2489596 RepID=UPI000F528BD8|nr:nuclear transport factor 2 family protein [Bradyrhizobium sp. RP6]RQH04847.1 nuclear transport factor 2 family protein [Bradyrhizobium sp. RP6]
MATMLNRALAACVTAVVFTASSLTTAAPCGQASSTQDDNKRTVTDAFDRWAQGGTTFFTDLLHDDVVWRIKGSGPSAGEFRGRDVFVDRAVRPFASRLSTPVRPTSVRIFADGDHVIAHWEGSGVARDGKPYANSYAWIMRMQDGKAAEVTAYLDLAPYDDVLRRIPSPAR